MVKVIKKKFVVIGKEGSTSDGDGFIQKLWDDADSHFSEIAHLAKRDAKGSIGWIWGAMSDSSRSFKRSLIDPGKLPLAQDGFGSLKSWRL